MHPFALALLLAAPPPPMPPMPNAGSLVHKVETGACNNDLAKNIDAATDAARSQPAMSKRLAVASVGVMHRCKGTVAGQPAEFHALSALAKLGAPTCPDAHEVADEAKRISHPSAVELSVAAGRCGQPQPTAAKPAPPSKKEQKLTKQLLKMPCVNSVAERKLALARAQKLETASAREEAIQNMVKGCTSLK